MKQAMTVAFKAIMVVALVTGFVFAGSAYSRRVVKVAKTGLIGDARTEAPSIVVQADPARRIPLKGL